MEPTVTSHEAEPGDYRGGLGLGGPYAERRAADLGASVGRAPWPARGTDMTPEQTCGLFNFVAGSFSYDVLLWRRRAAIRCIFRRKFIRKFTTGKLFMIKVHCGSAA